MSDLIDGGTPKAEQPDTALSGGTPAEASGGTETAGLTEDQKNLLEAWKSKAAEGNEAKKRLRELEERLAAAERAQYGQAQQMDPTMQAIANDMQMAALGDAEAQSRVALWRTTAQQAQELRLQDELDALGVDVKDRAKVKGLIRKSGFQIGVQEALNNLKGEQADSLAEQNRKQAEEIARLKAALEGRSVRATNGNPAATGPSAPAPVGDEMDAAEYRAIMARGGEEAKALREKGVKLRPTG